MMDPHKAIELLTAWQKGDPITSFDDINTATKLGIEALSAITDWRMRQSDNALLRLPSETPMGDSHHSLT